MRIHEIDFAALGPHELHRLPVFVGRINPKAWSFDVLEVVDVLQRLDIFQQCMSQLIDADRSERSSNGNQSSKNIRALGKDGIRPIRQHWRERL